MNRMDNRAFDQGLTKRSAVWPAVDNIDIDFPGRILNALSVPNVMRGKTPVSTLRHPGWCRRRPAAWCSKARSDRQGAAPNRPARPHPERSDQERVRGMSVMDNMPHCGLCA